MSRTRILVSHCPTDYDFCDTLVKTLGTMGADIWYDERNQGVEAQVDVIRHELGIRPIFIVVLSPAALDSDDVFNVCSVEYELWQREPLRIIVPVVAQPVERGDLDDMSFLADFPWVECEEPGASRSATQVAMRLSYLLALVPFLWERTREEREENEESSDDHASPSLRGDTVRVDDLVLYGKACAIRRQYDEAREVLQFAHDLAPDHETAAKSLAAVDAAVRFWSSRKATADVVLARFPTDTSAWFNAGEALAYLGHYEKALEAFEHVLGREPDHGGAWHQKAWVYEELGKMSEANESNSRASELGWRRRRRFTQQTNNS
jgi:hypothetical protein